VAKLDENIIYRRGNSFPNKRKHASSIRSRSDGNACHSHWRESVLKSMTVMDTFGLNLWG
jgi:hypothetical protein